MRRRSARLTVFAGALVILLLLAGLGTVQAHGSPATVQSGVETVIVLVDYTTSGSDHRILGTVVAQRPLSGAPLSSWQFNGTFDGRVVTASGKVLEVWQFPTVVKLICYELQTSFDWLLLLVREGEVRQDVQNLARFTFRYPQWPGEPPRNGTYQVNIDGWIHPPGVPGGQLIYRVSQTGAGHAAIKQPPKKLPGGTKPVAPGWREKLPVVDEILPWLLQR